MTRGPDDEVYDDILGRVSSGNAILFLGAGSTAKCKREDGQLGVTGSELAKAILRKLVKGNQLALKDHQVPALMEAAEYFQSNIGRSELDAFVSERLRDLRPSLGHYLAASFPWKAVITTNYNTVAELAWSEAMRIGFAARKIVVIRTDHDLVELKRDGDEESDEGGKTINLYKPHGCLTLQSKPALRMVITSQDYIKSETIRKTMYRDIRKLAEKYTTVFVGYSLADYTFRNLYYRLYLDLGLWARRSYSVAPIAPALIFKWKSRAMEDMKTTLLNSTFDAFMLRLVRKRGTLDPQLKEIAKSHWSDVLSSNKGYMSDLHWSDFSTLSSDKGKIGKERPKKKKRGARLLAFGGSALP